MLPLLLAAALALPVQAQDQPAPPAEDTPAEDTPAPMLDMFERMLRGFMTEIEPQMRELERGLEALEPEIQGFLDRMRGMAQYHPPEVLPNGDILIRRRQADDPPSDSGPSDPDEAEKGSDSIPFEL